jgi:hypothetical protein
VPSSTWDLNQCSGLKRIMCHDGPVLNVWAGAVGRQNVICQPSLHRIMHMCTLPTCLHWVASLPLLELEVLI